MGRLASSRGAQQSPTLLLIGEDAQLSYLLQRYAQRSLCRLAIVAGPGGVESVVEREQPALVVIGPPWAGAQNQGPAAELHRALTGHHVPLVVCSELTVSRDLWSDLADRYLSQPILYSDFALMLAQLGIHGHGAEEARGG